MHEINSTRDLNRARLKSVWAKIEAHSGRAEAYPVSTAEMNYLMSSLGYRVSRRQFERYFKQGLMPSPTKLSGVWAWSEDNLLDLSVILEQKRSWQPFNKLHYDKQTVAEREREEDERLDFLDSLENNPGVVSCLVERGGKE